MSLSGRKFLKMQLQNEESVMLNESVKRHERKTLAECYEAVANFELINDNNIVTSKTVNSYVVVHYVTPIAAFIGGRWYRNKTKYSVSTSRVLNGIFDAVDGESIDVCESDLKTLIEGGNL